MRAREVHRNMSLTGQDLRDARAVMLLRDHKLALDLRSVLDRFGGRNAVARGDSDGIGTRAPSGTDRKVPGGTCERCVDKRFAQVELGPPVQVLGAAVAAPGRDFGGRSPRAASAILPLRRTQHGGSTDSHPSSASSQRRASLSAETP